jgi:hypothetical protein
MKLFRHTAALAVALAALASACSSDSSVGPGSQQPVTLSQALGEMMLPALGGAASSVIAAPAAAFAMPVPTNCGYSAASQSFTCPAITVSGLAITQSYTLLDGSGNAQSQFDATTTASIRMKTSVVGTLTEGGSTIAIDEKQDMTLSGLLTGTHVLNGTVVMRMNGTVTSGSVTTPITSTMTMTAANLVLPKSGTGASAWPKSGTLTADMTTALDPSLPALVTHITMTFDGTSKVAVVITADGFTERCTIDLLAQFSACA